jgi:hypothetical protein
MASSDIDKYELPMGAAIITDPDADDDADMLNLVPLAFRHLFDETEYLSLMNITTDEQRLLCPPEDLRQIYDDHWANVRRLAEANKVPEATVANEEEEDISIPFARVVSEPGSEQAVDPSDSESYSDLEEEYRPPQKGSTAKGKAPSKTPLKTISKPPRGSRKQNKKAVRTPLPTRAAFSDDECMVLYVTAACCRMDRSAMPALLVSAEVTATVDRGERLHGMCKFIGDVPDAFEDVIFPSPNVALCELRDFLHPDHKLFGQKGGINVKANLCVDKNDKKSTINQTTYPLCSLLQHVSPPPFNIE